MKYWLIGGAVLFALWAYNDNHKAEKRERAAAAVAACERNPSCWGSKRDAEAFSRSLLNDLPTTSPTGRRFFKGTSVLVPVTVTWLDMRGLNKWALPIPTDAAVTLNPS